MAFYFLIIGGQLSRSVLRGFTKRRTQRRSYLVDLIMAIGYAGIPILSALHMDGTYGPAMMSSGSVLLLPRLVQINRHHWLFALSSFVFGTTAGVVLAGMDAGFGSRIILTGLFEAIWGAVLLQNAIPDGRFFDTMRRAFLSMLIIGAVVPGLSAAMGVMVFRVDSELPVWDTLLQWYFGRAIGALVIFPALLLLMHRNTSKKLRMIRDAWGWLDVGLVAVNLAVTLATFGQTRLPVLFVPFVALAFVTLRYGLLGAVLSVLSVAVIGITATASGLGPLMLISSESGARMQFFCFYLLSFVLMALPLSAELNRRKFIARRLEENMALFRIMTDRSGDILFNIAPNGHIRYVSPSIARYTKVPLSDIIGTQSLELIYEEDRIVAAAAHGRALARPDRTFVFEYRSLTDSDGLVWFESHARATIDDTGKATGVISAARDISLRKQHEFDLSAAANSDPLTSLANRRAFDEDMRRVTYASRPRSKSACLAIIDIDFFKRVNDDHGHAAGDQVLREVAACLRANLRANDIIARIGGEEFGLILHDLKIMDADRFCDRLLETVAGLSIEFEGRSIPVTVSIGLANIDDYEMAAEVLAAADAALYLAKADGRNCLRLAA
jgi:diguanylate cyclase (GGDEF)-like protein/PAS domain S-box-containing protein